MNSRWIENSKFKIDWTLIGSKSKQNIRQVHASLLLPFISFYVRYVPTKTKRMFYDLVYLIGTSIHLKNIRMSVYYILYSILFDERQAYIPFLLTNLLLFYHIFPFIFHYCHNLAPREKRFKRTNQLTNQPPTTTSIYSHFIYTYYLFVLFHG